MVIEELEAFDIKVEPKELPRFATDAEAGFKEESSDVTWNSIEEFSEAATSSGMLFNSDFIPVNIEAKEFADKNGFMFCETSAFSGKNVCDAFDILLEGMIIIF